MSRELNERSSTVLGSRWFEPPFFRVRTIDRTGVFVRLTTLLAVMAPAPFAPPEFRAGIVVQAILLAVSIDLLNWCRAVNVSSLGVTTRTLAPGYISMLTLRTWNPQSIQYVQFVRATDIENRFGRDVMIIHPKYGKHAVLAVGVSVESVVLALETLGVPAGFESPDPAV